MRQRHRAESTPHISEIKGACPRIVKGLQLLFEVVQGTCSGSLCLMGVGTGVEVRGVLGWAIRVDGDRLVTRPSQSLPVGLLDCPVLINSCIHS